MKIQFITLSEFGKPTRKRNVLILPPLTWPVIASYTPKSWEITVQDEHFEQINTSVKSDIVAFSLPTAAATRAYELAGKFKMNGSKIIYGGPHITHIQKYDDLRDEPFKFGYADSIIIGEAEQIWEKVLSDFGKNDLRATYRSNEAFDLKNYRLPRREIEKKRGLIRMYQIESSRGCPYRCAYCISDGTYRPRSLESLTKELEHFPGKKIFFLDSNFGKNLKDTLKIIRLLKKLRIRWATSIDATTLANEDFVQAAKENNCISLYVGFESIDKLTLESQNKYHNQPMMYEQSINNAHKLGVPIIGSFIFGFDSQDKDVFRKTIDFCNKVGIMEASFHILTPFPGTAVFEKLRQENRLLYTNFPDDWGKYTRYNVVLSPNGMSTEELHRGYEWTLREFYSFKSIYLRIFKSKHIISVPYIILLFSNIIKHFTLKFKGAHLVYT